MRRAVTLLAIVLFAGCTHQAAPDQGTGGELITAEQIEESHATSAYDAILKLHANFLSNRGKTTIMTGASSLPVIYVDGNVFGGIDALRNIPAAQVASIRLYRAWESAKFGSNRTGGVIEVVTKQ